MSVKIFDQIRRIERFLLEKYEVSVDYSQDNDNAYYQEAKLIDINTRQNFKSRLHTLLHEAGHVILRNGPDPTEFRTKFSFMRDRSETKRGNKSHRVDVVREEVLAWEEGYGLASQLGISLDEEKWSKHRQQALTAYVEWV